MRSFFCQKSRYFSSPSTFAFFRPKPIEVVAIIIRILQLCVVTAYTQIAAHLARVSVPDTLSRA